MANEKTNYFETAVIDYFLRPGAGAPTRPTSVKVGLLVAITDAEAGTVTEASYAGYAAMDCGFGASADNGGAQRTSNAAQIDFTAIPAGPDVTVIGAGIKDHLGNWLLVKALASKTFSAGDVPRINANAMTHDES
jgi:hypothetical protein